jgi:hypothetical protein
MKTMQENAYLVYYSMRHKHCTDMIFGRVNMCVRVCAVYAGIP